MNPWGGASDSVFAHPRANEFAVPAALGLGLLVHPLGLWVVSAFFYHEFGHALAAWLCGHWAVPIPIAGFTFWDGERSWLVTAAVIGGLGWIWKWARREEHPRLLFLATIGLVLSVYALLALSASQELGWMVYGGCAGEIVFSTLAILAFYWPAPERLRWDFWRWPLLLSGAVLLVHALIFWGGAHLAPDERLLGEALATARDGDQDWVRLVREYGWTSQGMADSYYHLALAGAAVVAVQYLLGLGTRSEPAPSALD